MSSIFLTPLFLSFVVFSNILLLLLRLSGTELKDRDRDHTGCVDRVGLVKSMDRVGLLESMDRVWLVEIMNSVRLVESIGTGWGWWRAWAGWSWWRA